MKIANTLQFEISDNTGTQLLRLLKTHPDLSRLAAGNGTAAIDAVLEFILSAGINQLERCSACSRSTAIDPGSCRFACYKLPVKRTTSGIAG